MHDALTPILLAGQRTDSGNWISYVGFVVIVEVLDSLGKERKMIESHNSRNVHTICKYKIWDSYTYQTRSNRSYNTDITTHGQHACNVTAPHGSRTEFAFTGISMKHKHNSAFFENYSQNMKILTPRSVTGSTPPQCIPLQHGRIFWLPKFTATPASCSTPAPVVFMQRAGMNAITS